MAIEIVDLPVIFHSYVSLPEGIWRMIRQWLKPKAREWNDTHQQTGHDSEPRAPRRHKKDGGSHWGNGSKMAIFFELSE